MQLIDSAHDKSNIINTIATHDFENKGSLDELWNVLDLLIQDLQYSKYCKQYLLYMCLTV